MARFISPSNVQSGRGFVPPPPTPPERKFFVTAESFELLRWNFDQVNKIYRRNIFKSKQHPSLACPHACMSHVERWSDLQLIIGILKQLLCFSSWTHGKTLKLYKVYLLDKRWRHQARFLICKLHTCHVTQSVMSPIDNNSHVVTMVQISSSYHI